MTDGDETEAAEPGERADDIWSRTTAPQSPYTTRQIGIGLAVFVVLALVAFVLPLALA